MDRETNTLNYHMQDNSDVDNSILKSAARHYASGNYREALNLLLDATHRSTDSDLYVDVGNCYFKLGDYKEAIEYWNRAIEFNPKNSSAYANMGNLYYKTGQVERAISLWLVALITKPEDANTSLNLAIAFNEKMMRFESIKYFEKYVKYCEDKNSEDYMKVKRKLTQCFNVANGYLTAGANFQNENNYKQAAACYFKSLANYPNLSKTNLNLGSIFFEDRNLELSIKYWTIASHIDPHYAKIYSNLAISYDLMKKFDYAYCYYYRYMNYIISNKEEYYKVNRRLLKLKPFINGNPKLVDSHLEKAKKHLANNELDDAIDEFKNYSILCPEKQSEYKDTIKKLESYINPEVEIISNCFEIGNDLIAQGRFSEAKPYFFRIMKLSSPQFLEFSKAKAKYSQCERGELESEEQF